MHVLIASLPIVNIRTFLQPINVKASAKPAESDEESDEEEVQVKTPVKKSSEGGSKTIFVKNLAWAADQDKV